MRKLIILITSAVLLFGFVGCDNNSKSSKFENKKYLKTIDFIKSNIDGYYSPNERNSFFTNISINNCKLTVQTRGYPNNSRGEVNLSDINPNTIEIYNADWFHDLTLNCKEGKDKFSRVYESGYRDRINSISLNCSSNGNAERARKAFKWLIEYCEGTDGNKNGAENYSPNLNNSTSNTSNTRTRKRNPCDNFSFEVLGRGKRLYNNGIGYITPIYVRSNTNIERFIEYVEFDSGKTFYQYDGKQFGSLHNAVKYSVGCN